ncbi:MAG: hypothetical protein JO235_05925 [Chroococcidiopsidaceae cyanobacterium CP_BM_RX_35]|nr:hypothetical protein [Chroococcidiopsidaceae cyanobacterium CP_BM_RX_35]
MTILTFSVLCIKSGEKPILSRHRIEYQKRIEVSLATHLIQANLDLLIRDAVAQQLGPGWHALNWETVGVVKLSPAFMQQLKSLGFRSISSGDTDNIHENPTH